MQFKWLPFTVLVISSILLILMAVSCVMQPDASAGILVEAESFSDKGGWLVDPQFVEKMGSPYLLAHGLGEPVVNARTRVAFPSTGTYHVWVRSKNWVPGDWEAPGRFRLIIDGIVMDETLGTETGWKWHYAGETVVESDTLSVELQDLTGFDGRCDAVYFSKWKQPPPEDPDGLRKWRETRKKEKNVPVNDGFDVVIVGGGIAGCAAAIAAAEQGMKVALIHDRPVLGGNASSEIRVHTEGIPGNAERIISMINTRHWPNGSPDAREDDIKRHRNIEKYDNIHLALNWRAYDTETRGNVITAVKARHTSYGGEMIFKAPLYIDCTGDGWIGYWSGAETMYGREPASEYDEYWDKYGDLWSPGKADNRVMGSSVLWRSADAGADTAFPEVPWAMDVAGDHAAVNGSWRWEFSRNDLHQIDDAEQIRDHMFRAIYGSFYNAKQKPENVSLKLEWVSYLIGKRESRRIVGDYIYTFNDVREMKTFDDAVVVEKRPVDVHYQQNRKDLSRPDFLSEALYYRVELYYLPYRTLYSKDIENLFMAGRCFSCSHIGLGGPRVMHTTGQMGVAVGYAAALCKKYETTPRGIYEKHIAELQALIERN